MPHIAIDSHRLDNGLRVVLAPEPRSPVVAVHLRYAVGSGHEKDGATGLAHLFEHLMFQGSTNVAKGEHFSLIEACGGKANATTSLDRTDYHERLPGHELELALWLEADRLAGLLPAMTQQKLDNQREVVKNERRRTVDNQPYGSWAEGLQALLFPVGHPYQHPIFGSMEDLDAASLADVRDFFAVHYAPSNAVLVIAGDIESTAALALVERHFGPIPASRAPLPGLPTATRSSLVARSRETVLDRVPLPRLYFACRAPAFGSGAFEPMQVAMDLLGWGRASRLHRALVRERQLAQEVERFAFPEIGGATIFVLAATARSGITHDLLEAAMLDEMERLAAEGPTDEELSRVRTLYAAETESSLERVAERADRLSMYAMLFDEPERINREVERYASVEAAAVRDALGRSLRPDSHVLLTYLPSQQ